MIHINVEDSNGSFHEDDVFQVDRGFCYSLDISDELGIRTGMSHIMSKGQKQMTTLDVSASRRVAKVGCFSIYLK